MRLLCRKCIHHQAMSRDRCIRSLATKARVVAVNYVGFVLPLGLIVHTELVRGAFNCPVDEHVGSSQQLPKNFPAFIAAEVKRNAALVLVPLDVTDAHAVSDNAPDISSV